MRIEWEEIICQASIPELLVLPVGENRMMACSRIKLWVCLFFAVITLALFLPVGAVSAADPVVNFPDANLEAVIRENIKKPTGDIHQSDLENVYSLNADIKHIGNLTGLEYCINLQSLFLSTNQINDISPLASLTNVDNLDLSSNQINNISPLAAMTNLFSLDLSFNQVKDISPLVSLTKLKAVYLHNNPLNVTSRVDILPRLQNAGVTVIYYSASDTTTPVTVTTTSAPSITSTSIPTYERNSIFVAVALLVLVVIGMIISIFSNARRLKRAKQLSDTAKTTKHYTSIKLFVRTGQNVVSLSKNKDKLVDIFLDGENIGEFGWEENRDLVISDGKHELTVVPKLGEKYLKNVQPVPQTLSFEAGDEDIIRIFCHYMEHQGWSIIKDRNVPSNYYLKLTFGTIYFIGAYNLVVGLLFTLLLRFDYLRPLLGFPLLSIIVGVIYLGLGFLVQRKSYIALIIAIGLVVLDLILAVITLIPGDIGVILWGAVTIIIHIFLLSFMVPGLSAIKALRQKEHISTN